MARASTKPAPVEINTEPGTALAGIHALLDVLLPQLTALEQRVKELKGTAVPLARQAAPGAESIIVCTPGTRTPLSITHSEPLRFDAKGFETANPEAYAAWKVKGDQWAVGRVKS